MLVQVFGNKLFLKTWLQIIVIPNVFYLPVLTFFKCSSPISFKETILNRIVCYHLDCWSYHRNIKTFLWSCSAGNNAGVIGLHTIFHHFTQYSCTYSVAFAKYFSFNSQKTKFFVVVCFFFFTCFFLSNDFEYLPLEDKT